MSRRTTVYAACLACLLAAAPAGAWHGKGHLLASRQAAALLPPEVPAFLRDGATAVAHFSLDPDTFTRPIAPDDLHAAESPEHFFDLERLAGADIPARRYDLLAWCYKNDLAPAKVGLAPYAIAEWTQRLTVAFAEHRRWGDNPHIRQKCLLYAGMLAHYAQDVCQPLHTTVHYDGRLKDDGASPRSGIHNKLDALLGKLPAGAKAGVASQDIQPLEALFPAVIEQIKASHALVDKVYEMEKLLPAYEEPMKAGSQAEAFARDRLNAAAAFTARLILTAWRDSAGVKLPDWHQRADEEANGQAK